MSALINITTMTSREVAELTGKRHDNLSLALSDACFLACNGNHDLAIKKIGEIDLVNLNEPMLHLFNAALGYIGECFKTTTSEKTIQSIFFENLDKYIPGAVEIKTKTNSAHIPDGFICLDDQILPVEVKKVFFGVNELKQLTRYMDFYGCKKGVAVAPAFSYSISSRVNDVIFVKIGCFT
jgi:hypothetical protein